jgi:hypothetical protein
MEESINEIKIGLSPKVKERYLHHNLNLIFFFWGLIFVIIVAGAMYYSIFDTFGRSHRDGPAYVAFAGFVVYAAHETAVMLKCILHSGAGLILNDKKIIFNEPYKRLQKMLSISSSFEASISHVKYIKILSDNARLRIEMDPDTVGYGYTIGHLETPIEEVKALIEQRIEQAKER